MVSCSNCIWCEGVAAMALADSSFTLTGDQFVVTPQMKEKFRENGYIVVRSVAHSLTREAKWLHDVMWSINDQA